MFHKLRELFITGHFLYGNEQLEDNVQSNRHKIQM